jgi:hypothetical protein
MVELPEFKFANSRHPRQQQRNSTQQSDNKMLATMDVSSLAVGPPLIW